MPLTVLSRATYVALFLTAGLSAFASVLAAEPTRNTHTELNRWTDRTLTLDERKLFLEAAKLDQEKKKARHDFTVEISKAVLTALSVGVPLVVAVLAYRAQKEAQRKNETLQFKLKAAEIAMAARDSNQVKAKAVILKALFPNELGEEFNPQIFDPKAYPFSAAVEAREKLIALLAEHPSSREEIIKAWGILFPWDAVPGWKNLPDTDKDKYKNRWFEELRKDKTLNQNIASDAGQSKTAKIAIFSKLSGL